MIKFSTVCSIYVKLVKMDTKLDFQVIIKIYTFAFCMKLHTYVCQTKRIEYSFRLTTYPGLKALVECLPNDVSKCDFTAWGLQQN